MWFSLSKVQSKNAGLLLNRVFEHISVASSFLRRSYQQVTFCDWFKRLLSTFCANFHQKKTRKKIFRNVKTILHLLRTSPKLFVWIFAMKSRSKKPWKLNNFLPCLLCSSLVYLGRQIRIQEFLEKIWRFSMNNFCNFIRFLFFVTLQTSQNWNLFMTDGIFIAKFNLFMKFNFICSQNKRINFT